MVLALLWAALGQTCRARKPWLLELPSLSLLVHTLGLWLQARCCGAGVQSKAILISTEGSALQEPNRYSTITRTKSVERHERARRRNGAAPGARRAGVQPFQRRWNR